VHAGTDERGRSQHRRRPLLDADQEGVLWQTIIHCVFILSAIGIAWTDKLMSNSHSKSHDKAHDH